VSVDNIQASTNSVVNAESLYYILEESELLEENTQLSLSNLGQELVSKELELRFK
jgi:hypothetical protein